jgi:hypothetical protein
VRLEQIAQALGLPALVADQQHPPALLAPLPEPRRQHRHATPLVAQSGTDIAVSLDIETVELAVFAQAEDLKRRELDTGTGGELLFGFDRPQIELVRRHMQLTFANGALLPLADLGGKLVGLQFNGGRVEYHPMPERGIVEKSIELSVIEGKQEGTAGRQQPLAGLVKHRLALRPGNAEKITTLLESAGKGLQVGAGEHHFSCRQQYQFLEFERFGSLAGRVEGAHPLDVVAEKLDAYRKCPGRRVDIEDIAAQREGAAILHHRHRLVAKRQQPREKRRPRVLFLGLQAVTKASQYRSWDHPLQQRPHRHHHRPRSPFVQGGQGCQACRLDFRVGSQGLVRTHLPVREEEDLARFSMVEGEVGSELLGLAAVGSQHQQGVVVAGEQRRQQIGAA